MPRGAVFAVFQEAEKGAAPKTAPAKGWKGIAPQKGAKRRRALPSLAFRFRRRAFSRARARAWGVCQNCHFSRACACARRGSATSSFSRGVRGFYIVQQKRSPALVHRHPKEGPCAPRGWPSPASCVLPCLHPVLRLCVASGASCGLLVRCCPAGREVGSAYGARLRKEASPMAHFLRDVLATAAGTVLASLVLHLLNV